MWCQCEPKDMIQGCLQKLTLVMLSGTTYQRRKISTNTFVSSCYFNSDLCIAIEIRGQLYGVIDDRLVCLDVDTNGFRLFVDLWRTVTGVNQAAFEVRIFTREYLAA